MVTLRDCVREAVDKARTAMTFVVLQGAVTGTVAQGPAHIVLRRHAVFSQAVRHLSHRLEDQISLSPSIINQSCVCVCVCVCVSQLSAVVCGFVLKLYGGLEDQDFLQQLHSVGVLAQFEGLLSTYGTQTHTHTHTHTNLLYILYIDLLCVCQVTRWGCWRTWRWAWLT